VWASKESYREHAANVNNNKKAGNLVKWDDYVNVQSNFIYEEKAPHVNEQDSAKELQGGTGGGKGFFLDSCGGCNSGAKCADNCGRDNTGLDVSVHPNNNRSLSGRSSTWRIVQTRSEGYDNKTKDDCCGNELWPLYGNYIYLTQAPGEGPGFGGSSPPVGNLRTCGDCHHHCSSCNKNILDVILRKGISDDGKSRWQILSAIGIPNGRRIRYGQPIHLKNGHTVSGSKLQATGAPYDDRQTYLDICGKCDTNKDSTNKCIHDDCAENYRRDVSTSFSPHRDTESEGKAGTGTWRFLPTNYTGDGWGRPE